MSNQPFWRQPLIPGWVVYLLIIVVILVFISVGFQLSIGAMLLACGITAAFLVPIYHIGGVVEEAPKPVQPPRPERSDDEVELITMARRVMESLSIEDPRRAISEIRKLRDAAKERPPKPPKEKGGPKVSDLQGAIRRLETEGGDKDRRIATLENERGDAVRRREEVVRELTEARAAWDKERPQYVARIQELLETVARLEDSLRTAQTALGKAEEPLRQQLTELRAEHERLVIQTAPMLTWGGFVDAQIDALTRHAEYFESEVARISGQYRELEARLSEADRVRGELREKLREKDQIVERMTREAVELAEASRVKDLGVEARLAELDLRITALVSRAEEAEARLSLATTEKTEALGKVGAFERQLATLRDERDAALRELTTLKSRPAVPVGGGNRGKVQTLPSFTCRRCPDHLKTIGERDSTISRLEAQLAALGDHLLPLIPGVLERMISDYFATRPIEDICDTSPEPEPDKIALPELRKFVGTPWPEDEVPPENE